MIPLYATRLNIIAGSDNAETLMDECVDLCFAWMTMVAARVSTLHLPDTATEDFRIADETEDRMFRGVHFSHGLDRCWQGTVVHPFTGYERYRLRTEIQLRDVLAGEVVLTLRMLLTSTTDMALPVVPTIKPPRLIRDVLERYPNLVSSGNLKAFDKLTMPPTEEIMDDLVSKILDQNRMVPIVVISRMKNGELPVRQDLIETAAQRIASLGRIFVLPDEPASFILTDTLTKKLSTYLGAIRIYWPGFQITDSSYIHRLWTIDRVSIEGLTQRLPDALFDIIASASARSIGPDTHVERVYQLHQAAQHESQVEVLRAQYLQATRDLRKQRENYASLRAQQEQQSSATQVEREELQWLVSLAESEVEAKQAELDRLNEDVFTIADDLIESDKRRFRIEMEQRFDLFRDEIERKYGVETILDRFAWALGSPTIGELTDFFFDHFADDALILLPEARESAHLVMNRTSRKAYLQTLIAIRNAAIGYRRGKIESHRDALRLQGESQFKSTTPETMKAYPEDYQRTHALDGEPALIWCDRHIRSGGNTNDSGVGIYWHIDTDHLRYIVGHIGAHLRVKNH